MQAIEFTEGNGFTTETQKARSRSTEKLPPKSFDRARAEVRNQMGRHGGRPSHEKSGHSRLLHSYIPFDRGHNS